MFSLMKVKSEMTTTNLMLMLWLKFETQNRNKLSL